MQRRVAGSLFIFILIACNAFAVDTQNANWLLYEQGNALMDQREYGRALKLFQEAVKAAGIFPEAELAIGDVYLEEGEIELALSQYEKAYNIRKSFYIPQMQYTALYKIADVYEKTDRYKKMEDSLDLIVQDDKHFMETASYRLRTQIEKTYAEKGLDRVLVLYSFDDSFASKAHSRLGWFYYRSGRYPLASSHLLFSLINRVAQIKSFLIERDADYQFGTFSDLLRRVDTSQELMRYAEETGLYADIYYLAGSTYASGFPKNARVMWKMVSEHASAGKYRDLSARQAAKPWLEPLLSPDR
jgi:hypothetical protein